MNCEGVRGLLSAYLDGELTSGELLRVEQHLRRCHGCASEVESLRKTISLVAGLDEVPLPADFHAKLHQRLVALGPPVARRPVVPAWQRSLRTWAIPAAAAAAALAVGLSTMQEAPTSLGGILAPRSVFEQADNKGTAAPPAPAPKDGTSTSAPAVVTTPVQPVETPRSDPAARSDGQPQAVETPPAPSNTPEVTTTAPPPAPIGVADAGLSEAHAVSYFDGLPEMASIPAYAHEYRFAYRGGDPVSITKALEAKFAGKVEATDSQITLKLSHAEAEAAVKAVREILGAGGVQEETRKHDYGAALELAFTRVQALDGLRDQLYQAQAKVTDKAVLETAAKELEGYRLKAADARQEITRIQGFVSEATVVIKFTKQVQ